MRPQLFYLEVFQSVIVLVLLLQYCRQLTFRARAIIWSCFAWLLSATAFIAWVAIYLFRTWNVNPACPACQVHLPPYSNYWYQESFYRYGAFFGVNIAAGLVFGFLFWIFSRVTHGRVIDRDDVFLLTLSGMMVGWPNILVFLVALFVLGTAVYIVKRLAGPRVVNHRVIITPFIPLAALPILFWGDFLASRIFNLYDIGLVAITLSRP